MTAFSEPKKITSPTLHATIIFTISVFVAILAMSFLFKVEVVARGGQKLSATTSAYISNGPLRG